MIGYAFLLALLGSFGFNFHDAKENPRFYSISWVVRCVALFFINWAYFYFILPSMAGPWVGFLSKLTVLWLLNLIVLGITAVVAESGSDEVEGVGRAVGWGLIPFGIALIATIWCGAISPCSNNQKLRNLVKVVEAKELEEVDTKHIRRVSKETAMWLGDKVIGEGGQNIGSMYMPGAYHIQRVNNELYWVAPLEFRGFWKWMKQDTSPGFIMVSAEDPNKQAKIYTSYKMKYMRTSYWGSNLDRHIYTNGYMGCYLTDFTLELTDELKPMWVVTVLDPTVAWTGEKVRGVVIVEPETGEMNFHKIGEVPGWVDRVMPEDLAERYNTWWGKYVHGFWNNVFSQKDVHIPTSYTYGSDVWLVYGNDGNGYWFTGHTSPSSEDKALVGYTMMNSRTGEMSFFSLTGPNEDAVVQAVNSEVSNYSDWRATQPIPYNIYGMLTYAVPIIVENKGIFKNIALVDSQTTKVVRGETLEAALRAYRKYLSTKQNGTAPSSVTTQLQVRGKVTRITSLVESGETVFYLLIETEPDKCFTGTVTLTAELALTESGDEVTLSCMDTTEEAVPMMSFDNLGIQLQKSRVQQEYEELQNSRKEVEEENWDEQKELERRLRELREKKGGTESR